MQRTTTFGNFVGLDLRMNKEVANARTLRQAVNVDLTLGGGVKRRGGMRPVATLDAQSKGLYALNGSLRAVIPSGQSLPMSVTGEVQIVYDAIGTSQDASYSTGTITTVNNARTVTLAGGTWPTWVDENAVLQIGVASFAVATRNSATVITLADNYPGGSAAGLSYSIRGTQAVAYPTNTIERVTSVESIGANAAFGVYPYLVIKRTDGRHEHHWLRRVPALITDAVNTKVDLPFAPGAALLKMQGKLWAEDNANGVIRFSSTANGPEDWSTPYDAGFIAVLSHITGDRVIRGLGMYDDKLAVLFEDATQLWNVHPDPGQISLSRVMEGPGTEARESVCNVLGDLFYFSQGGFRSLNTAAITGQIQEGDQVGAPVYALTKDEDASTANPVAVWSQARGQYLCAFGSTVYVYRYSPKLKLVGWTTYELAAAVDAMVEHDGSVYIRSGTAVYRLDADYDDGSTFTVQTSFTNGKNPGRLTRYDFLELIQEGTCQVHYRTNPRDETVEYDGPTVISSTSTVPLISISRATQALSLVFTGTDADWQLDEVTLHHVPLGR